MKIGNTEKSEQLLNRYFSTYNYERFILQAYMIDEFILSVEHNGQVYALKANMIPWGYSHKFRVTIDDTDVFFEPDEEGSYRAVMMPGQNEKVLEKMDRGFMQAVQESIEKILA